MSFRLILHSPRINIELNIQTSDDKRFKNFALIAINIAVVVVVVYCRFVVLVYRQRFSHTQ